MHALVIIGDSISCPRPSEDIGLRQTYAWKLQEKLQPDFYVVNWAASDNNSRRATSSGFLATYLRSSDATYAVVQLGIVDCAPRLMSNLERLIVGLASRVPGLRILNAAYVRAKARHRFALTKWFPRTLVPRQEYETNMRRLIGELLEQSRMRKVFVVNIAQAGAVLLERSYGIAENISSYNEVLASIVSSDPKRLHMVNIGEKTQEHPEWITRSDGHHLRSEAHAWIADAIACVVRADIEAQERSS